MAKPDQDLGGKLTARIEDGAGGTRIVLTGNVTEAADFTPLLQLRGPLRFDLGGIERINSLGVRGWVHFVRTCETSGLELTFERVSPVLVQQMSMISNFMGARSRVASLFVPYLCPSCEAEDLQLVTVEPGTPFRVVPTVPCPKCNSAMQLDELETMYPSLFPG